MFIKRSVIALVATAALGLATLAASATPAAADYGSGVKYQVTISANLPGRNGGGLWLWFALTPSASGAKFGTADYAGADCGHGGVGAISDKGDSLPYTDDGTSLVLGTAQDPISTGLGPMIISVPDTYGHTSTVTFQLLNPPPGFPPAIPLPLPGWSSQVQVAP
jgi:hypothetical protein